MNSCDAAPSLPALNHDNVVPKLRLHRRLGIHRLIRLTNGQRKRRGLKILHHGAARLPAQTAALSRFVLAHLSGDFVERLPCRQSVQGFLDLARLLAEDVTHVDAVRGLQLVVFFVFFVFFVGGRLGVGAAFLEL